MRGVLSVFFIFFITKSCFASKPVKVQPAFQTGKEKKSCILQQLFEKLHGDHDSVFIGDSFEHPSLTQPLLKKQTVACTQLFWENSYKLIQDPLIKTYVSTGELKHSFIYHFLYPKHVFW